MNSKLLGWVLVAAVAGGCGPAGKRQTPLIDQLREFNESVRWQQFDKAALSVPVLEREDFLDEREELAEDLEIDDFVIKRMRYRNARTWARVDVLYTWHLDSRGIVHKTTARQIWEVSGKAWIITAETRVRGEPMPGLNEPEPEDEPPPSSPGGKSPGTEEVTTKTGPDPRITQ